MSWVVFKSKASADVRMLAVHAAGVLQLWGRDPAQPGILLPADMELALQICRQAIHQDDHRRAQAAQDVAALGDGGRADDTAPENLPDAVSLLRRLWPLMAMLERCQAAGEPIVWQL